MTLVATDAAITSLDIRPVTAYQDAVRGPTGLSDEYLVAAVMRLARCERNATAELVAHLAELDARRLYLAAGYTSLFAYCTAVLRLSEHEAYNRIEAARASRRFPIILERLRTGSVNLTTVRLLAPHFDAENHAALLDEASGRSKREVEEIVARHYPLPPVPESVRRLPTPQPPTSHAREAGADPESQNAMVEPRLGPSLAAAPTVVAADPAVTRAAPQGRAGVAPLAAQLYKVTFTARASTREKLRRAQDLLRHQVPDGNLAEIFDRALSELVGKLERDKLAATVRPRPGREPHTGSRHIPAEVRRRVWRRDGGRCAFVARDGTRCGARGFLEFHHAQPYAAGGDATVANIALRCRAHNAHEAGLYFGPRRAAELGGTQTHATIRTCGASLANGMRESPTRSGTSIPRSSAQT